MLIAGTLVMAMFGTTHALAGGSGVAAFEQLKALVGHWETDKSNTKSAKLDLETDFGRHCGHREISRRAGQAGGNDHALLPRWR